MKTKQGDYVGIRTSVDLVQFYTHNKKDMKIRMDRDILKGLHRIWCPKCNAVVDDPTYSYRCQFCG